MANWIVRCRCQILKDVMVSGCSKEDAQDRPFDYAEDEIEVEQHDYEVVSVTPNE